MSDPAVARPPLTPGLAETGLVAILRGAHADQLRSVAGALAGEGIRCLELTLTTPGALDALRALAAELDPDIALGIGSVTTAEQAQTALEAGATFLVSPAVCAGVCEVAAHAGVACYPGAWTPTEILSAWNLGATAVKLFPAASGGPRHLRDVRAPLPNIPLIPTGGVAIEQIGEWLAAGAAGVGLGGPLIGDALDGGSLAALRERAGAALGAVRAAKEQR